MQPPIPTTSQDKNSPLSNGPSSSTTPQTPSLLRCLRPGCLQHFSRQTPTPCYYHPGRPIFHDIKKGWTCCQQIVYDWDQFQKLKGCMVGEHSQIKGETEFGKSGSTAGSSNNNNTSTTSQKKPVVKSIDDYNREEEEKKKKAKQIPPAVTITTNNTTTTTTAATTTNPTTIPSLKTPFLTPDNLHQCINPGCLKKYPPNQNIDQACQYHSGQPLFRDLKKYWSCCQAEAYDWDQFMKLPKCRQGQHQPKMIG